MNIDSIIEQVSRRAVAENRARKEPNWSEEETRFLSENYYRMTDAEIASALGGRTATAVKIRRIRRGLPSISRARMDYVSALYASKMLGVECHKVAHWCDAGIIPCIRVGSGRQIRLVRRRDLAAWAVNPANWVYYDWRNITDPHLRRLCELRAARWGDEWWNARQVADYHGVDVNEVTRLIHMGRIEAVSPPVSLGGRRDTGARKWAYWFVRKSVAVTIKFRSRLRGDDMSCFTPRGDAWVMRARNVLGLSWSAIARTMRLTNTTIKNRYERLMSMVGQADDAMQR